MSMALATMVLSSVLPLESATAFVQPPLLSSQRTKNMLIPPPQRLVHQRRAARPARTATSMAAGAAVDQGSDDLPRVLCHGEVLFDCIAIPDAAGWDLERVEESAAWAAYPGGAPANAACALAKLGVPASFVGAVGRDEEGDELLKVLEAAGVGTELATRIDDFPTRTVMVTRDLAGDRTFAGFGGGKASDSFADCQHRLCEMEDAARGLLKPGSWVVQGTLGLAYPGSFESHVCLAEWAQEAGAVRFLDINWRPVFWELAGEEGGSDYESLARERISAFALTADVVKLTDEEAEWLCGVSGETALADPSCLQRFFPAAKAILVTAGEKGASYVIGDQTGSVPVFESINAVETTGAGDAFSAGFISEAIKALSAATVAATAAGESPLGVEGLGRASREGGDGDAAAAAAAAAASARDMVRFASAVGALTCCGDGAIKPQPSRGDVLGLLQREPQQQQQSGVGVGAAGSDGLTS